MKLRIERIWRRGTWAADAQPCHSPLFADTPTGWPDDQVASLVSDAPRADVTADHTVTIDRASAEAQAVTETRPVVEARDAGGAGAVVEESVATQEPARTYVQPEQPVVLAPARPGRAVRVGEVLPAVRSRALLARLPVPHVPKRAILAAGVCAGLAAPGITRHVATRLLFGSSRSTTRTGLGALEITRVTYTGPITSEALSMVTKALERTGR
ncbi:MAG: hypothetical protein IT305_14280 [Chloroflexi bacterium]|nr:hypothetical protein [Chloroflexota bacterium]